MLSIYIGVITVNLNQEEEYSLMHDKMTNLFYDFQDVVESAKIRLGNLKRFIRLRRPQECDEELKSAGDLTDLFIIVRTRLCSLVNHSILVRIAEKFKLSDAFTALEAYEIERQNYREMLLGATFAEELKRANEHFSHHPTANNTIILKLKWSSVTPFTVAEFKCIVEDVFREYIDFIHTLEVKAGSIIVTMCAPERIIPALIVMAKKRVLYLKEIGVTRLTIGGKLIVSEKQIQVYYTTRVFTSCDMYTVENI